MIDDLQIEEIARELFSAQAATQQIEPISKRFAAFGEREAYRVAAEIHTRRLAGGDMLAGRKLGFTNAALWPVFNVDKPIWAYVYQNSVHSHDELLSGYALVNLCEPMIEPEIVLHFAEAPGDRADPSEIYACVDWIANGFELVQSHFSGWQFEVADTIADQGLHGALVIGRKIPARDILVEQLSDFVIELERDGVIVDRGGGAQVLGSPLKAVAHLLAQLSSGGAALLTPGELVTTGSLTQAFPVAPGETWSTRISGLPATGLSLDLK